MKGELQYSLIKTKDLYKKKVECWRRNKNFNSNFSLRFQIKVQAACADAMIQLRLLCRELSSRKSFLRPSVKPLLYFLRVKIFVRREVLGSLQGKNSSLIEKRKTNFQ